MTTVTGVSQPVRPLALAGISLCGVLAGGLVGGLTNAVNGRVSPEYFVAVLRWGRVEDVWRASIAQGVFEGLAFGVLFSLAFTAGVGLITRASCPFGLAFRYLLGVVGAGLVGWVLGGLAGMGLAALSPEFFRATFIGVPQEFPAVLAYAWVGGSIWGLELGGLMAVVIGLVLLRAEWRRGTGRPGPVV